jgi:hypothetical protein
MKARLAICAIICLALALGSCSPFKDEQVKTEPTETGSLGGSLG